MWEYKSLRRLDFRVMPILFCLMLISLFVISAMTGEEGDPFWTPLAKSQLRWYCVGWGVFFFTAGFDYRKLREWSSVLYVGMFFLLVGLFFVDPIQNVHRWYRLFGAISLQPSEQAQLVLVIAMSWFLERRGKQIDTLPTALQLGLLVGIPFLLILKQPDLGTALILFPITLGVAYFAGVHRAVLRCLTVGGLIALLFVSLIFSGTLSHEAMKGPVTTVLKEYQYERLNPNTYHQKASQIAIALGGLSGSGWHKSEFSGRKWLPMAHTDSVFAAYAEEFGFVGVVFLLFLFYMLVYCSFQVARAARDPFGRLLAVGLSMYLAMHVLANVAMMCALLPVSGVPLIFVTYGGSSLMSAMGALGILQSIYSKRFMF
jgi:rod shape determining protein RodA